ncbi:hypothetical protein CLV37_101277 [Kineococcus rhizosphaerae]|uniref:Uncharacterized protein n=1 Tax=Kineococcus rhizosphaerae TaxID=559628 RepID=A0A2T0RA52_9ACTN|nr:hypothetical protein CLV37_101277 [Kineococcus rhizosphaerae]
MPGPSGGRKLAVLGGLMVLFIAALALLSTWALNRG